MCIAARKILSAICVNTAASRSCVERVESVDVMSFRFSPAHISQFVTRKGNEVLSDDVLKFKARFFFY
jgi:hypothetical protein